MHQKDASAGRGRERSPKWKGDALSMPREREIEERYAYRIAAESDQGGRLSVAGPGLRKYAREEKMLAAAGEEENFGRCLRNCVGRKGQRRKVIEREIVGRVSIGCLPI